MLKSIKQCLLSSNYESDLRTVFGQYNGLVEALMYKDREEGKMLENDPRQVQNQITALCQVDYIKKQLVSLQPEVTDEEKYECIGLLAGQKRVE